jgi:hypothetical protein
MSDLVLAGLKARVAQGGRQTEKRDPDPAYSLRFRAKTRKNAKHARTGQLAETGWEIGVNSFFQLCPGLANPS